MTGTSRSEGSAVDFSGSATDPEDGPLSGTALTWTSDRDGAIGAGTGFSRGDLSVGRHSITLTARDSHGARGTASSDLTIVAAAQTGWVTVGSPFSGAAREIAVGASGSELFVLLGWNDPAAPAVNRARVEEWNGTAWAPAAFRTDSGDRLFDAAAEGNHGAVVWNDEGLRFGRAEKWDGATWEGSVVSTTSQRNSPSVTFAFGEPIHGWAQLGRWYVDAPFSTTLPEVSGGVGQEVARCTLLNSCIGRISLAGDRSTWYAALEEQAGCISVQRATLENGAPRTEWLGPCFILNGGAAAPQVALLHGRPVVGFTEDTGRSFVVAWWSGTDWVLIGVLSMLETTRVDLASDGSTLHVLFLDPTIPGRKTSVHAFDGSWTPLPGRIEAEGSRLSGAADLAIFEGQPVVAMIEDGRAVVKRFVPAVEATAVSAPVARAPVTDLPAPDTSPVDPATLTVPTSGRLSGLPR